MEGALLEGALLEGALLEGALLEGALLEGETLETCLLDAARIGTAVAVVGAGTGWTFSTGVGAADAAGGMTVACAFPAGAPTGESACFGSLWKALHSDPYA